MSLLWASNQLIIYFKFIIMRKHYLFLLTLLSTTLLYGQSSFVVTYNFNDNYEATIEQGAEALIARKADAGGARLLSSRFVTEGSTIAWEGEIRTNVTTFTQTYIRMDIIPQVSYKLKVTSIVARQKMNNTGGAYNFRVGCTLGGTIPVENISSSPTQGFTSTFNNFTYTPLSQHAETDGADYISAWLTARCLNAEPSLWSVDEVKIYGTYEKIEDAPTAITVSNDKKQRMRFGVDLAALWYFHSNKKDQLAQLAVGDMKPEFVRIAFANNYQTNKNVYDESAYAQILEAMEAMRNANSDILYFGSPGALHTVYSEQEKVALFGHVDNVPWSPFPLWVQEWNNTGNTKTMEDGTVVPIFEKGAFHRDELVKCLADHLNFMHRKGFPFAYMDLSNEQTIVTPAIAKYVTDNLPAKLDPGVQMPKIIVPSTWNVQGGVDWLREVDKSKGEHLAFDIAAIHNTGAGGSLDEFGSLAIEMGKEAWNSEMHEWIGLNLHDDIMNSDILWQHMRAGFSGINTWLFFGSAGGRPHSMINSGWGSPVITKTGKYEIFKQLVNNADGGNYVEISKPYSSIQTSAFIKDNILTIWTLNKIELSAKDIKYQFEGWSVEGKDIEVTKWHKDLPLAGQITSFTNLAPTNELTYTVDGESLYLFKINLGELSALSENEEQRNFEVYQDKSKQIIIKNNTQFAIEARYSITDVQGKNIANGRLNVGETKVTAPSVQGFYIVSIAYGNHLINKKMIIQ